jgi:hypothetical protein
MILQDSRLTRHPSCLTRGVHLKLRPNDSVILAKALSRIEAQIQNGLERLGRFERGALEPNFQVEPNAAINPTASPDLLINREQLYIVNKAVKEVCQAGGGLLSLSTFSTSF